ncbi:type II toxin-antitoxin system PrlF family antitoxin [Escherichia coli]
MREALKLKPGQDSIHYEILPGGQVFISCRLQITGGSYYECIFCVFWMQISRTTRQKTRPFNIQQGKKLVAGMDVNIDDEIGDDE